ncbi:MAG TPA: hypothetical protein PKX91_04360 [Clostridia bacterium]|jgi:hypothetical protein|nr:hypothetical protein [Clostridia bacterium]
MKKRKKKQYDDDDGRVIAPMNVDGMPWYIPDTKPKDSIKSSEPNVEFSKKDSVKLIFKLYALIIPIALVFIAAVALLIVFVGRPWAN